MQRGLARKVLNYAFLQPPRYFCMRSDLDPGLTVAIMVAGWSVMAMFADFKLSV